MTTRLLVLLLLVSVLCGCASDSGGVRVSGQGYVALLLAPADAKAEQAPASPADWWAKALEGACADPEVKALLERTYGVPVQLTFLRKRTGEKIPTLKTGLSLAIREGEAKLIPSPLGERHPLLQRTFTVVGSGRGIHAHPERQAWREARKAAKTTLDRAVVSFPLGWPDLPPLQLALEDYVRRKLAAWRVLGNQHGPPCFATPADHARYVKAASDLYRTIAGWHDH